MAVDFRQRGPESSSLPKGVPLMRWFVPALRSLRRPYRRASCRRIRRPLLANLSCRSPRPMGFVHIRLDPLLGDDLPALRQQLERLHYVRLGEPSDYELTTKKDFPQTLMAGRPAPGPERLGPGLLRRRPIHRSPDGRARQPCPRRLSRAASGPAFERRRRKAPDRDRRAGEAKRHRNLRRPSRRRAGAMPHRRLPRGGRKRPLAGRHQLRSVVGHRSQSGR